MKIPWLEHEDQLLTDLVQKHGKQWTIISKSMMHRTPAQVAARWEKCINPILKKGAFTQEEDSLILDHVKENGTNNWPLLQDKLPGRSPKQCRERWFNHLDPTLKKSPWTLEEDSLIKENVKKYGMKWSFISRFVEGRSDNDIKNRWYSYLSREKLKKKYFIEIFPSSNSSKLEKKDEKIIFPLIHSSQFSKSPLNVDEILKYFNESKTIKNIC